MKDTEQMMENGDSTEASARPNKSGAFFGDAEHCQGYSVMRDGRAFCSGEWEKGNYYLFVSNNNSYLSVYDSEVQAWISSK